MRKETSQQLEFYRQLGDNIRKCRKGRNLSQERLAALVGLTRTSLTNIEKGRQHPPLHTFCEILEQLNSFMKVDAADLLPRPAVIKEHSDIKTLAELTGQQVRGANELAFIEAAIKGGEKHANSKEQDSGNS